MSYIFSPLGPLKYVDIWHDNSGSGKYGSWYLNNLTVTDVFAKENYIFNANIWLAVEESDGQIDRRLWVATEAEQRAFKRQFEHRSMANMRDGHIWFSVVSRPAGSRFTRLQRASCCFCLLATAMLANAMFYGVAPEDSQRSFSMGPFALSYEQVSNFLITFNFHFLT